MAITIHKKSDSLSAKVFGPDSPFERKAVLFERHATPELDRVVSKIKSGVKMGAVEKTRAIEEASRTLRNMRDERVSISGIQGASRVETALAALIGALGIACISIPGKLASDVRNIYEIIAYVALGEGLVAVSASMLFDQAKAKWRKMKSDSYDFRARKINDGLFELINHEFQKSPVKSEKRRESQTS